MRHPVRAFEDLVLWQKAHQFGLVAYRMSRTFPRAETYGLAWHLRRAAVSIAASIAQGSLEELRYCLILARDLAYGQIGPQMESLGEVSPLLDAYSHAVLASES